MSREGLARLLDSGCSEGAVPAPSSTVPSRKRCAVVLACRAPAAAGGVRRQHPQASSGRASSVSDIRRRSPVMLPSPPPLPPPAARCPTFTLLPALMVRADRGQPSMGLGDKERLVVVHHDGGEVQWRVERPLLSMHDLPPLLALGGMIAWVSALAMPLKRRCIDTLSDMLCSMDGRHDVLRVVLCERRPLHDCCPLRCTLCPSQAVVMSWGWHWPQALAFAALAALAVELLQGLLEVSCETLTFTPGQGVRFEARRRTRLNEQTRAVPLSRVDCAIIHEVGTALWS